MKIALIIGIIATGVLVFYCLKFLWYILTILIKGKNGKKK